MKKHESGHERVYFCECCGREIRFKKSDMKVLRKKANEETEALYKYVDCPYCNHTCLVSISSDFHVTIKVFSFIAVMVILAVACACLIIRSLL